MEEWKTQNTKIVVLVLSLPSSLKVWKTFPPHWLEKPLSLKHHFEIAVMHCLALLLSTALEITIENWSCMLFPKVNKSLV